MQSLCLRELLDCASGLGGVVCVCPREKERERACVCVDVAVTFRCVLWWWCRDAMCLCSRSALTLSSRMHSTRMWLPTTSVPPHRNLCVAGLLRGVLHPEAHAYNAARFVAFCIKFCTIALKPACGCNPARVCMPPLMSISIPLQGIFR